MSALCFVTSFASNCGAHASPSAAGLASSTAPWLAAGGKVGRSAEEAMKALCWLDVEEVWEAVDKHKGGPGLLGRKVRGLMDYCR